MSRLPHAAWLGLSIGLVTSSAQAQSVNQLKQELAAQKATNAKLVQRLRELERDKARTAAQMRAGNAARIATASAPASVSAQVTVIPPPPPPPAAAALEDADRALERTLVREGAAVLPAYSFEVTPEISYAHWDTVQDPYVRNSYSAVLNVRMGLPGQSQVSVNLPYVYNQGRMETSSRLGDVSILFSKELLAEMGWSPNIIASVGWTSPTRYGGSFGPIPFVSGFQAGVTATKKLDPIVVFAGVNYFSSASREVAGTTVDAPDVFGGRAGASLALSPATSATIGFSAGYLLDAKSTDLVVRNSDRILSTLDLGISTILWRKAVLNVTGQFGVTGHVPDFRLITSIPVRF